MHLIAILEADVSITQMRSKTDCGLDIMVLMLIKCLTDLWYLYMSGMYAASSVSSSHLPDVVTTIHQAAKANSHCRWGIARTGCTLGEHLDCGWHHYELSPEAQSIYPDPLHHQVVNMICVPLVTMQGTSLGSSPVM